MAEVDRRGFLRMLRRSDPDAPDPDADENEAAPAPPEDPDIRQLADLTARLLADLDAENEAQLAEAAVLNAAYDRTYIRVTSGHIVFSVITGISAFMKTSDVVALETEPEIENDRGHGARVPAVIRAHHPADLPNVTRTYGFRFPADSPLIAAIRTACDLPEPEPEPEEEEAAQPEADAGAGAGPAESDTTDADRA